MNYIENCSLRSAHVSIPKQALAFAHFRNTPRAEFFSKKSGHWSWGRAPGEMRGQLVPVPEPSAAMFLSLVGLGVLGVSRWRRIRV